MMRNWYVILFMVFMFLTKGAFSGAKVTQVAWNSQGNNSKLDLVYQGNMNESPDWTINGSSFSLFLPHTTMNKVMDKTLTGNVHLKTSNSKEGALIVGTFPANIKLNSVNTSLNVGNGTIQVIAPTMGEKKAIATPAVTKVVDEKIENQPTVVAATNKIDDIMIKETLDESYLAELEKEEAQPKEEVPVTILEKKPDTKPIAEPKNIDTVKVTQSAVKKASNGFSLVGYAGKFIGFLGVVLLLFWGLVQLMKKGFLGKGKLSFLNGQQLVSVISTTYIGPKRSLLLVKVQGQVFLVGQSESGMHLISEVHNVPGVIKETEKILTGVNFDMDLNESESAEAPREEIKLKENIMESKELPTDSVRDVARFSKELKKKVRNLKPLQ